MGDDYRLDIRITVTGKENSSIIENVKENVFPVKADTRGPVAYVM